MQLDYVSYMNTSRSGDKRHGAADLVSATQLHEALAALHVDKCEDIELANSPFSPIQTQLQPLMKHARRQRVTIDKDSINYILLDDEHELQCASLVVANKVDLNTRDTMRVRSTCLLPKIKGLVSLCLLINAPMAELR